MASRSRAERNGGFILKLVSYEGHAESSGLFESKPKIFLPSPLQNFSLPATAASVSVKWCGQASPEIGTPRFFASRSNCTLPAALRCWQCTRAPRSEEHTSELQS